VAHLLCFSVWMFSNHVSCVWCARTVGARYGFCVVIWKPRARPCLALCWCVGVYVSFAPIQLRKVVRHSWSNCSWRDKSDGDTGMCDCQRVSELRAVCVHCPHAEGGWQCLGLFFQLFVLETFSVYALLMYCLLK
jgi:hypothetical protein